MRTFVACLVGVAVGAVTYGVSVALGMPDLLAFFLDVLVGCTTCFLIEELD